jgi:PAS domain S-box-containing protein
MEFLSVLFLEDRDTVVGPLAETFLRRALGDGAARIVSAVLDGGGIDVDALAVMSEEGLAPDRSKSRSLADLRGTSFDIIITVSEGAERACSAGSRAALQRSDPARWRERLPLFVGSPVRLCWDIDRSALVAGADRLQAVRAVRDLVRRKVDALVADGHLAALLAERRRTKLLVDALDVGIVVHDESRCFYLFNRAAERVTGFSRDEVLGRDCHVVFGSDGICGGLCAFRGEATLAFERRDYEVAFTTRDGVERRLRMLVTPIEVHEGRPVEVVAQVADVTEITGLRWQLKEQQSLRGIVGVSPAMRGVFETIRQVAPSDYPVLVTGESGTGKELVARAIHEESRRAGGPFVPINCGALPEHILESELFGHVRGAFTGAIRDKKGRFELAHGGTLFLDEVGELTPAFQVKLLRVLQEMRFERVGGEQTVSVDVRVISATNRDLRQMVGRREFREDLFYRLCVVPIALPPMRERRADVPLLVGQVLGRIREETGKPDLTVSASAMDLILGYPWPGNVRELINALQFASIRTPGVEIFAEHLPPEVRQCTTRFLAVRAGPVGEPSPGTGEARGRKKLTPEAIEEALARTGGNKVKAARLLGVGRATLYRFLDEEK